MTTKYIIVGISDDQDVCECCGKSKLKKVVHLEDTETGHTVAYGVVCAAKAQKITIKEQKTRIKNFEKTQLENARKELWPYKLEEMAAYDEAPNDFNDPDNYKKRCAFLNNDSRVIAFRSMLDNISNKYEIPIHRLS